MGYARIVFIVLFYALCFGNVWPLFIILYMREKHAPTIVVLASGSGSTVEAFIRATQTGRVAAAVGLVICSNPPEKAGVYSRIKRLNEQYGVHTSERVLELGLPFSMHTVHVVAAGVDRGLKIAEHPVQVLPGDTAQDLFSRVQTVEKDMLPIALAAFLNEQRAFNGDL